MEGLLTLDPLWTGLGGEGILAFAHLSQFTRLHGISLVNPSRQSAVQDTDSFVTECFERVCCARGGEHADRVVDDYMAFGRDSKGL